MHNSLCCIDLLKLLTIFRTSACSVQYIVYLTVNELMLTLELECADSNERWSGEFSAEC
jgi:hypothetical protein